METVAVGMYNIVLLNQWRPDENTFDISIGDKKGNVYLWKLDKDSGNEQAKLVHQHSKTVVRQTCFGLDGRYDKKINVLCILSYMLF